MKSSSRGTVSVSVETPIRAISYSNSDYAKSLTFEFGAGDTTESIGIVFDGSEQLKALIAVMNSVIVEFEDQPGERYITKYASE